MQRTISEQDLQAALIAYLKEHGPQRIRKLTRGAALPYERTVERIRALIAEGVLVEIAGGTHRGIPCPAYGIRGDSRNMPIPQTARASLQGALILAAMQSAARARLMQPMAAA